MSIRCFLPVRGAIAAVLGIIAATQNNGVGIDGMNYSSFHLDEDINSMRMGHGVWRMAHQTTSNAQCPMPNAQCPISMS